ncbi:MAG: alpha/beta fold hydrolase [Pseudomonadota bacterium]
MSQPLNDPAETPTPRFLDLSPTRRIAYHKTAATAERNAAPGVVFLGGFRSDMTGTKAVHLEAWAAAEGLAFLRLDYTGHGQSSGAFEEGCIGDWSRDAMEAVAALTEGPQILVGSSMGGWISCLVARAMPDRVAGLVGIAAAPDFTEDSMWAEMPAHQRSLLMAEGRVELPSDYSDEPYVITRRLIEDGREHLVLRQPLVVNGPVRLLHGTADSDVDPSVGLRLLDHLESPDARLTFVKDADHRMSEPRELALLTSTVAEVLANVGA